MAQLYKITNTKNKKIYYGLVESPGKTFLDRFGEHMKGEGGVWIKKDLEVGLAVVDDFKTELICEGDSETIEKLETQYIRENNTLYPNGYNGNCGRYIINTDEVRIKRQKTRQENISSGKTDTKVFGSKGQGIYRYSNGDIRSLPMDHPDILSGKVKHINYRGGDIKEQERKEEQERQREKNGGYTDKQIASFETASERVRKYTITHENWKNGRSKFSERMERKEFTEKEIKNYETYSDRTTNFWTEQTEEYKVERTKNGLDNMNSKVTCEYCGMETNKGNHSRWHGDNCKMKES